MSPILVSVIVFVAVVVIFEAGATIGYFMGRRDEHRLHDPGGAHDIPSIPWRTR